MAKEIWSPIPDFSSYAISNIGRVYNQVRERFIPTSQTQHGHVKVSIQSDYGQRHTLSVALLVANAFVERPDNPFCDHVLLMDGKLENVAAANLAWRPEGFCWKYRQQLATPQYRQYENLAVYNVTNRRRYPSIVACGKREGLLFEDIWNSCNTGYGVFPFWHVFRITERV